MLNTIKTIKYGTIQIVKDDKWLLPEVYDLVEDCEGWMYEVRKTITGKIFVAYDNQEFYA